MKIKRNYICTRPEWLPYERKLFQRAFEHFRTCCFLFMQMNCRIFSFCKMAYHVSFEAIETYLHKNVCPSDKMDHKDKKGSFWNVCESFSMLHGQLTYNNIWLVISSAKHKHTIISDVYKVLGKGIYRYRRFQTEFLDTTSKAMSKNLLRNATKVRSTVKVKTYQLNLIATPLKLM